LAIFILADKNSGVQHKFVKVFASSTFEELV
jgi:hypothetical protein